MSSGGDPGLPGLVGRCTDLVRGRKVVLAGGVLAGATSRVRQLRSFGAEAVLVLAEGVGTGELPGPQEAEWVVIPPAERPVRVSDEVRSWLAFVHDPPAEARLATERFDPSGEAICLLGPFPTAATFLGRAVLGGRTSKAAALEDKTRCDSVFDDAEVRRAPSVVVPSTLPALTAAAGRLDRGQGTVWSGDASQGVNGAGDSVRWVRTPAEAEAAAAMLGATSATARVMPFLEGVPCSIHGFVLPDGVAAFRPVEQVVLRLAGSSTLRTAGLSSCWEPPAADREYMRSVARRVGARLRSMVGYGGAFSVDGVLTAQGFLPTEINPRFSGGLNTIARGVPDLPLELAQAATVRGIDIGATARGLEDLILPAADARPHGSAHTTVTDRTQDSTVTLDVALDVGPDVALDVGPDVASDDGPDVAPDVAPAGRLALRVAREGDPVVGTLEIGPAQVGALVRFLPSVKRPGLRLAPYAVAALALSDRLWGTSFGPLEAAPDVRA